MSIWGKDPAMAATIELGAIFAVLASAAPSIPSPRPLRDGSYSQREVSTFVSACRAEVRKGNEAMAKLKPIVRDLQAILSAMTTQANDQAERIIELEMQVRAYQEENERLKAEARSPAVSISYRR
jgi:hypothetical protein